MGIDKTALSKLIIKLQQGDGMVFEDIYNATRESAYFTALKISKSEDDAEDILQESYIYMLENIGAVENPDSFQSWFNRVVANKAKDLLRKNHPERFADAYFSNDEGEEASIMDFVENEDESFIPEASLDNAELAHEVMKMIDSLGDDKRTAVVLYYYNDMTTKEIAESLDGQSPNMRKSTANFSELLRYLSSDGLSDIQERILSEKNILTLLLYLKKFRSLSHRAFQCLKNSSSTLLISYRISVLRAPLTTKERV